MIWGLENVLGIFRESTRNSSKGAMSSDKMSNQASFQDRRNKKG